MVSRKTNVNHRIINLCVNIDFIILKETENGCILVQEVT